MLDLDWARAPAIERSEMALYDNIGSFLIDSIAGLWRSRNVTLIYVQLLMAICPGILALKASDLPLA